jgi:IclR family transcriptional regulator, pca regulon regulatory protein
MLWSRPGAEVGDLEGRDGAEADGGAKTRDPDRDFVKSLERGLSVIRALGGTGTPLTLVEVGRQSNLTRAAARRFLLTLIRLSYVDTDGRYYWLRPRVLELGYAYLSGLSWPDVVLPHVERLVAEVEDASEVGILDGPDVVFVLRVPGPQIVNVAINIGARLPANATALGKVLLAGLSEPMLDEYFATAKLERRTRHTIVSPSKLRAEIEKARVDGWATCDQELEEALRAIAVPIHDKSGEVVAALNLSSHVARRSTEALREDMLAPLQRAAAQIEADLRVSAQSDRPYIGHSGQPSLGAA